MANKTVEEIVAKAKSGDMTAFDLLYCEYSEKLLKYVVKLGVGINDAEDIVSDSFMEAIEHIGDLKNNAFFSTWLHSIAKNKVYTMKQKEKRHARVDYSKDDDEQNDGLDLAYSEVAEYRGDTVMLPEDYAENEEIKQILADAVNSLNADQRDAVFLYYYKSRTVSEIARQTGVNENTVKSRLSLARKYMERKLKDLQKSGVMLCAVPISNIIGKLESEARISVGGAPALASVASGKAIAAAVTAIVVGTTGAMFYFGRDRGQLEGDEPLPENSYVDSIDETDTPVVLTEEEERFAQLPVGEPTSSYNIYDVTDGFESYIETVEITHNEWLLMEDFANSNFTDDMTNYQKAVTAYDYIINNTDYTLNDDFEVTTTITSPVSRVLSHHIMTEGDLCRCFSSIMCFLGYEPYISKKYKYISNDEYVETLLCQINSDEKEYAFGFPDKNDMNIANRFFCKELVSDEIDDKYVTEPTEYRFLYFTNPSALKYDTSDDASNDTDTHEESLDKHRLRITENPLMPDKDIMAEIDSGLIEEFANEHFTDEMTKYQKAITAYQYIVNETQLTDENNIMQDPVFQILKEHKGNSFSLSVCMASFLQYLDLEGNVIYGKVLIPDDTGEDNDFIIKEHYSCYIYTYIYNESMFIGTTFDPFLDKETASDYQYFCSPQNGYIGMPINIGLQDYFDILDEGEYDKDRYTYMYLN